MKRRAWPWWVWMLGGTALIWLVLALAGVGALAMLLDGARDSVDVSINGSHWDPGFIVEPEHGVLALLGVAAVLLVLLFAVPVVVVLALGLGLLGATLGIGIAALAVTVSVAAVTSPLWLSLLVLWLLLRRRPAKGATATMAP